MSTELLDTLKQQAERLSAEEQHELAQYLKQRAATAPARHSGGQNNHSQALQRQQHMQWLKAHREEYAGRYVALDGDRLVGQGKTLREAHQQAKAQGIAEPFLMRVSSVHEVLPAGL